MLSHIFILTLIYFFNGFYMTAVNFRIAYIVPFTHKITPIKVIHANKKIYEHIVMPWETGISKTIEFVHSDQEFNLNIDQLKIINSTNKMPITLESVHINDTPSNITTHLPQHQKQIYFDTFFKACNLDATIFKITNLPDPVTISHSYVCNGHLYVPKCDRFNSILNFHETLKEFNFSIECYHNQVSGCLYHIECHYNSHNINTKIIRPNPQSIHALHEHLKNNFSEAEDIVFEDDQTVNENNVHDIKRTG